MTEQTEFEKWHARAMELAEYVADIAFSAATDMTAAKEIDAAREALAAHLRSLPMGEPVAWADDLSIEKPRIVSENTSRSLPSCVRESHVIPLYTNPAKEQT